MLTVQISALFGQVSILRKGDGKNNNVWNSSKKYSECFYNLLESLNYNNACCQWYHKPHALFQNHHSQFPQPRLHKLYHVNIKVIHGRVSPPWPSGYKRRNPTLVPVMRVRFKPRCGRPHFAPTRSGVRVCGRNRTEAREREWAEGTVSSLPGTLNIRIKFCHSTGIARSSGGVRASTKSYA